MCQPRRPVEPQRNCSRELCEKDPIYAVVNHDRSDDDTDTKEGTIVEVAGWDGVLVRVRTVSDKISVCLWEHELYRVNGYAPEQSLLSAVGEYRQSRDVLKPRQIRMDHIHRCHSILADLLDASRNQRGTESLQAQIESALTLLEYYEHHLDWKNDYPSGEGFFICRIGKAILVLHNGH
jgi:hypothetical protein